MIGLPARDSWRYIAASAHPGVYRWRLRSNPIEIRDPGDKLPIRSSVSYSYAQLLSSPRIREGIVKAVAEDDNGIAALAFFAAIGEGFYEQRLTLKAMPSGCRGPGIDRRFAPRRRVAAAVKERRHPKMKLAAAALGLVHQLAL